MKEKKPITPKIQYATDKQAGLYAKVRESNG